MTRNAQVLGMDFLVCGCGFGDTRKSYTESSMLYYFKNYQHMKNIHIGSLIRKKVKEKELRIIDFVAALHCNRSNVYSIFERKNVDMELLTAISEILEYDFPALYHKNKDRQQNYKIVLETNAEKMKELLSDNSVRIIELQEVSK